MSERPMRYHLPGLGRLPSSAERAPRGGSRPYRGRADAERSLLRQFWQDGCMAIRSAGSGGPFDLCIVLDHGGRLLQVKLCRESPTDGQINRWLDALPEVPEGWSRELWVRTPRGWAVYEPGRGDAA